MFGYVTYDRPHLYIKDLDLYGAMYCGLCKGIKRSCGDLARFSLSYDVTFFSLLLHNLKGIDVEIKKCHCVTHPITKRKMAKPNELMAELGALNVILAYYKLLDNVDDGESKGVKAKLFQPLFKKAAKKYPKIEEIVKRNMLAQSAMEEKKCDSLDRSADPTATLLKELSEYFLQAQATEYSSRLFYALGKWIYLIDALDDYDKDIKKGNYNPFWYCYQEEDKASLLKNRKEDIRLLFSTIFMELETCKKNVIFHFNTDLVDNVLFRGLPKRTACVVQGKDLNKEEK